MQNLGIILITIGALFLFNAFDLWCFNQDFEGDARRERVRRDVEYFKKQQTKQVIVNHRGKTDCINLQLTGNKDDDKENEKNARDLIIENIEKKLHKT